MPAWSAAKRSRRIKESIEAAGMRVTEARKAGWQNSVIRMTTLCSAKIHPCTSFAISVPLKTKKPLRRFVVRPENISVQDKDSGAVKAAVRSSVFVGSHVEYDLLFNEKTVIKASVDFKPDMKLYKSGDIVSLDFDEKTTLFLDR